jgi:peptide subunit release factor 1 (eRF1)
MSHVDQLTAQLDRLGSADTGPFPVVSLYLDLRPNERGRDRFEPFLKKELAERMRTYPASGPERESLDKDAERIRAYVANVDTALNGLALFACSGADLFEAIPLAAGVDQHRLYISNQPHLYPLAQILGTSPRYLALLADTNSARIYVFAATGVERVTEIAGTKTKRMKIGGAAQARYQRHAENFHLHHAKEVVDAVARIVRAEGIDQIVIAGDEVIVPLLREQLPKDVSDRIVDVVRLDIRAPQRKVLDTTLAALREKDAQTDSERVEALLDAYRAGGLACVGVDNTRKAFELGQVDELLIAAAPGIIDGPDGTADALVAQAARTSAKVSVIEEASLLEPIGGVGAFLRFKV